MAMLTPLSLDEARALGRRWGVEVTAVEPIAHGSVNSNFTLRVDDGDKLFLRIYEESDHAAVEVQNRLLSHLVAGGIPTPAPLVRQDGGNVDTHARKPVCLFPFVEGRWVCQQRVQTAHLHRIGGVLGRLHRLGEDYGAPPRSRFDAAALWRRLEGLDNLSDELRRDAARLERTLEALEGTEPPATTVIHGDLFRDNALWNDDELAAVVDFESASAGDPAFDLMVAMWAWCFDDTLERAWVEALARGYGAERALGEQARARCFDQARAAAVRFAVTRITDYELRPRDVVAYKDYRRFLARLDALEALGPDGLARWLAAAR